MSNNYPTPDSLAATLALLTTARSSLKIARQALSYRQTVTEAARDYDVPTGELIRNCPHIWREMVAAWFLQSPSELAEALVERERDIARAYWDGDEAQIGRIVKLSMEHYINARVEKDYEQARTDLGIRRAEDGEDSRFDGYAEE